MLKRACGHSSAVHVQEKRALREGSPGEVSLEEMPGLHGRGHCGARGQAKGRSRGNESGCQGRANRQRRKKAEVVAAAHAIDVGPLRGPVTCAHDAPSSRSLQQRQRHARTSIAWLPGIFSARNVNSPRPVGSSITPSRIGLKSFINDSPSRGVRSCSAPTRGRIVRLGNDRRDAALSQAELDRRADICCRTGVIDDCFVLAGRGDFDIPTDPVVAPTPVLKYEQLGARRCAARGRWGMPSRAGRGVSGNSL